MPGRKAGPPDISPSNPNLRQNAGRGKSPYRRVAARRRCPTAARAFGKVNVFRFVFRAAGRSASSEKLRAMPAPARLVRYDFYWLDLRHPLTCLRITCLLTIARFAGITHLSTDQPSAATSSVLPSCFPRESHDVSRRNRALQVLFSPPFFLAIPAVSPTSRTFCAWCSAGSPHARR
jgi:hypothetical protein